MLRRALAASFEAFPFLDLAPSLPYHLMTPASQWQAQVGLGVSF